MTCPTCGTLNPTANRFCGTCGTFLVAPGAQGMTDQTGMDATTVARRPSVHEILAQLPPIASSGLSFNKTMRSIAAQMPGLPFIATGHVELVFSCSYGAMVKAIFLAIQGSKRELISYHDESWGARIVTTLDKSMPVQLGSLTFDITDESPAVVRVIGVTEIKRTPFDFGRGKRLANDVLTRATKNLDAMTKGIK